MASQGTAAGRVLLILMLVGAVVGAQAASLASEHSHQHSSHHCCGLCHVGPLPFLQPAVASALVPVLSIAWLEWSSGLDTPHEVLLAAGHSRAPPA